MAKDDRIDVEVAFQYLDKELKTFYTLYDELKGNCTASATTTTISAINTKNCWKGRCQGSKSTDKDNKTSKVKKIHRIDKSSKIPSKAPEGNMEANNGSVKIIYEESDLGSEV